VKKDLEKEKLFLQFSDWISNNDVENQEWIVIAQRSAKIDEKRNNLFTFSVLVERKESVIKKLLKTPDWEFNNFSSFGYPDFDRDDSNNPLFIPNFSINKDGINFFPFIYYISYQNHPEKDDIFEMLQHFHLYHRAYYLPEKEEYEFYDGKRSMTETVTRIEDDRKSYRIVVNKHFLKDYLAARKCFLIRYHSHFRSSDYKITLGKKPRSEIDIKNGNRNFKLVITSEKRVKLLDKVTASTFFGKDVIKSYSEPPKQRELLEDLNHENESFIVNIDEAGNSIEMKPSSHFTFTPIYFTKEVLNKYYNNPNHYEIDNRLIRTRGGYIIRFDPMNKLVVVWLKDLVELPNIEQKHWKVYNVRPKKKIPEEMYKRDLLAEFIEPQNDLIFEFKREFENIQNLTNNKFGQTLFKELKVEDRYNYSSLHIPHTDEWKEFDEMVNALVKVTTDSLDVTLLNHLTGQKIDQMKFFGSIDLFELLLSQKGVKKHKYESLIKSMRLIQKIRSQSASHRKGKGIKKTLQKHKLDSLTPSEIYESFLNQLTDGLNQLRKEIKNW